MVLAGIDRRPLLPSRPFDDLRERGALVALAVAVALGLAYVVALIAATPSHGLAVSPDGKSVWCASALNSSVYGYSLPDLKLIGGVKVGVVPDWLTFAPNSVLYVANAGSNTTSAVNIKAMKVAATIPVGNVPKRNITAVFP